MGGVRAARSGLASPSVQAISPSSSHVSTIALQIVEVILQRLRLRQARRRSRFRRALEATMAVISAPVCRSALLISTEIALIVARRNSQVVFESAFIFVCFLPWHRPQLGTSDMVPEIEYYSPSRF